MPKKEKVRNAVRKLKAEVEARAALAHEDGGGRRPTAPLRRATNTQACMPTRPAAGVITPRRPWPMRKPDRPGAMTWC